MPRAEKVDAADDENREDSPALGVVIIEAEVQKTVVATQRRRDDIVGQQQKGADQRQRPVLGFG
jgi:hypothetical protein